MGKHVDFTVYDRPGYFAELAQSAHAVKSGGRIALSTMNFDPTEPLVGSVLDGLKAAADNKADTSLAVDALAFMADGTDMGFGPMWANPGVTDSSREPYRSRFRTLDELASAGVNYAITNIPKMPFSLASAGRSHIKAAVINDRVFIGGCDLKSPEQTDVMIGINDAETASWVFDTLKSIVRDRSTRDALGTDDLSLMVDADTKLFIDVGVPGQSLIYEQALNLIDEAEEHVTITCQYFPGGATAQHLLDAHNRGVEVKILFSHPRTHGSLSSLAHHLYQLRERTRLPASFFDSRLAKEAPRMHAKVIATDKGIMVGSHNYVSAGVTLGTAEIALLHRKPALARSILRKINEQL